MKIHKALMCAAVLGLSYVVPANAWGVIYPPANSGGGGDGYSRSAPGPVVGLGLPALAVIGGYVLYRRRRSGK